MSHLISRSHLLYYMILIAADICFQCKGALSTDSTDNFQQTTFYDGGSSVVSSSSERTDTSTSFEEQVNSSATVISTEQHSNLTGLHISTEANLSHDGLTQLEVETRTATTDSHLTHESQNTTSATIFLQFSNSTFGSSENVSTTTTSAFTNTTLTELTTLPFVPFNRTADIQNSTFAYTTETSQHFTGTSLQSENNLITNSPTLLSSTEELVSDNHTGPFTDSELPASKGIDVLSESSLSNEINSDELQGVFSVSNISGTVVTSEIKSEITTQNTTDLRINDKNLTTTLFERQFSNATTPISEIASGQDQPLFPSTGSFMKENTSVQIPFMPDGVNFSSTLHEINTESLVGSTYPSSSKIEISEASINSFTNIPSASSINIFSLNDSDKTITPETMKEYSYLTANMTTELFDNGNETTVKIDSTAFHISSSPIIFSEKSNTTQITTEFTSEETSPAFTTMAETVSSINVTDNDSIPFSIPTHMITSTILTTLGLDSEPTSTLLATTEDVAINTNFPTYHVTESTTSTSVAAASNRGTEGTHARATTSFLDFSTERTTDNTAVFLNVTNDSVTSFSTKGRDALTTHLSITSGPTSPPPSSEDFITSSARVDTTLIASEAITQETKGSLLPVAANTTEMTFSSGSSTLHPPSLIYELNTTEFEERLTKEIEVTDQDNISTKKYMPIDFESVSVPPITSRMDSEFETKTSVDNELEPGDTTIKLVSTMSSMPIDFESVSVSPTTSRRDSEFETKTSVDNELDPGDTTIRLVSTMNSFADQDEIVYGNASIDITTKDTGFSWEPFLYQKSMQNLSKEEMENIVTLVFHAPGVTEQTWRDNKDVIFRNLVTVKLAMHLNQNEVGLENDYQTSHSAGTVIYDDLVYIAPTPRSVGDNFIISFVHYITEEGTRTVTTGDIILSVLVGNKIILEETLEMNILNLYLGIYVSADEEASLTNSVFKQYWIAVISLTVIGAVSLIVIFLTIMYVRLRNRYSRSYVHDMTHLKGDMNATNEIGDLNSAVDLLHDEMCEKDFPGLVNGSGAHIIKMGDDECWVVPYRDIPLEDKNPPDIQDTRL